MRARRCALVFGFALLMATAHLFAYSPPHVESVSAVAIVEGVPVQRDDGTRVRLVRADIPGRTHRLGTVKVYGQRISDFHRQIPDGETVYLVNDAEKPNRFRRALAHASQDHRTFLSGLLPKEAHGQVATLPPGERSVERSLQARREVHEHRTELWTTGTGITKETAQGLVSLSVDVEAELAVITNLSDEPLDITGWVLVSVEGNQRFTFPSFVLGPGETVTVTSGRNAQDNPPRYLLWTRAYVWNNEGDPARLLDSAGNVVAEAP